VINEEKFILVELESIKVATILSGHLIHMFPMSSCYCIYECKCC